MGALLGPYRDWQITQTPYQAFPKGKVSGNQVLNWILDHVTDVLDLIAVGTTSETYTIGSGGNDGALRLRAPSGGGNFTSELTAVSPTADRVVTLPNFNVAFATMPGLGLAWNAGAIDISPAADVSWQGFKLTSLGTPTLAGDATNKSYVDALISGLYPKTPVRVATAAALPAYARVGNVLTAAGNGDINVTGPGIDGVITLVDGDRVLLKDGAAGADNGLYAITSIGTAGAPWVLTRATDADTDAEVRAGLWVASEEGTAQADTVWLLVTNNPIVVNTTVLTFTEITGMYRITAGTGLASVGNTINVGAGTGIQVNANDVQIAAGGVGVTEIAAAIAGAGLTGGAGVALGVGAGTGISVGADTVGISAGGVGATELAAAVAGAGLTGGAGVALAVGAGAGITVNANDVQLSTDAITAMSTWKRSVRAATTGALPANTRVGNVLTADVVGALPAQDGIAMVVADRLLVWQEGTGANNGVYDITDLGSGGTVWVMTRSSESDTSAEMPPNHVVPVREGTLYADQAFWVTNNAITLNTTALTYQRITGLGMITAGDGIAATADTLNIDPVDFTGVGLEVSAGDIRLAAQGAGIAGGAGATLSVVTNIRSNIRSIGLSSTGEVANVAPLVVQLRDYDGVAVNAAEALIVEVSDSQYVDTAAATTTLTATGGGDGVVNGGSGTTQIHGTTNAANGQLDLDVNEVGAKTVYLSVRGASGGPMVIRPVKLGIAFA